MSVSLLHIVKESLLCLQVSDGGVGSGQCAFFGGVVAPPVEARKEGEEKKEGGRGVSRGRRQILGSRTPCGPTSGNMPRLAGVGRP